VISARHVAAAVVATVALVAVVLVVLLSIGGEKSQVATSGREPTSTSTAVDEAIGLARYTEDQLNAMGLAELQDVATARRISIGALSRGAIIEAILLAQQPLRSESKGCPGCWVR